MHANEHLPSRTAEIGLVNRPCHLCHRHRPTEEVLGRDLPERDDDGGIHGLDLDIEVWPAVSEFLVGGVAIVRWTTPDTVGDSDITPSETMFSELLVEDGTASSHEWFASCVLLLARTFAHEEQVGVLGSDAVDNSRTGFDELGTPLAPRDPQPVHPLHAMVLSSPVKNPSAIDPPLERPVEQPEGVRADRLRA